MTLELSLEEKIIVTIFLGIYDILSVVGFWNI